MELADNDGNGKGCHQKRPVIKRRRNRRYAGDRVFLMKKTKRPGLQFVCKVSISVYSKDVDIKIVIVVNTDTFLWISGHFGLESGVYGLHKAARKPCMSEELFWDKKAVPKIFVYSHLAPVDIHMRYPQLKQGN
jgi:hypothetical protein